MTDFIIIGVVAVIVGLAVAYIIKEKKRGTRCIGCSAGGCSGQHKKNTGCGCGCHSDASK